MRPTTAVIMAAGLSLRMGCNKLLLPYRGKPILQHCLDLVCRMGFDEVILITVPEVLEEVQAPVRVLLNTNAAEGQSVSVRMGAQAAKKGNSILFFPGDQPLLDENTVRLLLEADDGKSILYPLKADGLPSSPTLFGPIFRDELTQAQGDSGGRPVRTAHKEACRGMPVPNPQTLQDIDDASDYEKICESQKSN